jgi:hypothetical protein
MVVQMMHKQSTVSCATERMHHSKWEQCDMAKHWRSRHRIHSNRPQSCHFVPFRILVSELTHIATAEPSKTFTLLPTKNVLASAWMVSLHCMLPLTRPSEHDETHLQEDVGPSPTQTGPVAV